MSDEFFDVTWRSDVRVLELRLAGFWPEAQVERYGQHLEDVIARAEGQPFDVIGDLADLMPQAGSIVEMQARLIARLIAGGMRRLIVVGAGPLLTMQIKRAAAGALIPQFVDTAAAARVLLRSN